MWTDVSVVYAEDEGGRCGCFEECEGVYVVCVVFFF